MAAGALTVEDHRDASLLRRMRDDVEPGIRAAIGRLPAGLRHIGGYHLGWWDERGSPESGTGGKAVRGALVLAANRAMGGDAALSGAVAVELVHNFTLVHDDVMDRDATRRHRPTVWAVFGIADAILIGDALQALAVSVLAQDPHAAALPAMGRLAGCMIELCQGQSADCAFEHRTDITLGQCEAMAMGKTGSLFGSACAIGALYAGAAPSAVDALDEFGRQLGLAFQLVDDLLGIWGDPAVTGKPAGADLLARKKSLPVVAALTSGTAAGEELAAVYNTDLPLDDAGLERVADLVERAGGRDWARNRAAERRAAALAQLRTVVPDAEQSRDLLTLADLLTRRVN
ncbi:family 2 encapsulin nanocompartment cargo protein polyprenyl transferase [Catenulispora pinisilvae]|uniref:family 2 encapsulin nanocompartment cargo protein polyprenyl transferase n=1 Tax=Catenulispora pinisilvae TaxID=2705253 RepID=UPI00189152F9|nr:family 2 encapsulin nanocompartment cargo protein polyprenyl transferase [Catenulispora pinisilvae]